MMAIKGDEISPQIHNWSIAFALNQSKMFARNDRSGFNLKSIPRFTLLICDLNNCVGAISKRSITVTFLKSGFPKSQRSDAI